MLIDINKQYKTRDGRDVKIYTTKHDGIYPVAGSVDGTLRDWDSDGSVDRRASESPYDLIEVKPEQVVWVVVDDWRALLYEHEGFAREHRAEDGGTLYRVVLTDDMVVDT